MSSPTKQVSGRRLPPLVNPILGARCITSPLRISRLSDVEEREALLGSPGTSDTFNSRKSISQEKKPVTLIDVIDFLGNNPTALENYVMESVSKEQLERWLIRKIHTQKPDTIDTNESSLTSLSRWKFCVHSDKKKTLQHLTQEIYRQPQKARIMFELVKCISVAIHADRFSLYLLSKNEKELSLYSEDHEHRSVQLNQKIVEGTTVAAYVAAMIKGIYVQDILGDERFPDGIGIEDNMTLSVICQPIVQSDGKLAGIAEFVRVLGNQPFQPEDEEITTSYLTWGGITVHYAQISKEMKRQKNLHNFLLDVIKSLFDEMDTVDGVITNVMTYAKRLVDADRCAMFLCDDEQKELHADLFDEGKVDEHGVNIFSKGKEIRFSMEKGIAGYVAAAGKVLNIKDAYSDPRFNREVDVKTGYTTRTILCVPMKCKDRVVGVVQLINKRKGVFTSADEHAFILFAGYCGLAIRYSQIFTHLFETKQRHLLALDVLSYHCRVSEKVVQQFRSLPELENVPDEFWSYNYNMYQENEYTVRLTLLMAEQVMESCCLSINFDVLYRFILTVRKNYRNMSYHNWTHAFSVIHILFLIFNEWPDTFTIVEKLGLFFGALCHDIDHRGTTNPFILQTKSPIGLLYGTSCLEKHHIDHTMFLLKQDDLNIFESLDAETHAAVLDMIADNILATDLALFIPKFMKIEAIVNENKFDFKVEEHRRLLRHLMMTAADICGIAKPWNLHRQSLKKVLEEFYSQGDLEREMGTTLLPLFDRDKRNELPESQIAFFSAIGVKCYSLLAQIIPTTEILAQNTAENLAEWKRIAGHTDDAQDVPQNAKDLQDMENFKPLLNYKE